MSVFVVTITVSKMLVGAVLFLKRKALWLHF